MGDDAGDGGEAALRKAVQDTLALAEETVAAAEALESVARHREQVRRPVRRHRAR